MGTLSHHPAKADKFLNRADQTIDSHHPCILNCRRSACGGCTDIKPKSAACDVEWLI